MMSDNLKSHETCPVCEGRDITVFMEIPQVPVHCNLLWPTREKAIQASRGDIRLAFCPACGHIFNLAFVLQRMEYSQAYENSLHFSPRFQEYATSLAGGLIERYDLRDKDIIEIGCGKGEFLAILCELGKNRGVGFDRSYDSTREGCGTGENIRFICDFYSEAYAEYPADFICCRHVLEHIQYPREFLFELRQTIGKRRDAVVFFEVPNVEYTLRHVGIWDIIYEHSSYFSGESLTRVFEKSGFRVLDAYETFGGQFLCLEGIPASPGPPRNAHFKGESRELSSFVPPFAKKYQIRVKTWNATISRWLNKGRRIAVWGAGSKGVTFLNCVKAADQVIAVIDINPHKQGMFVAGTGHPIAPPESLRETRPDTILLMNPIYKDELRDFILRLGIEAEVVVA